MSQPISDKTEGEAVAGRPGEGSVSAEERALSRGLIYRFLSAAYRYPDAGVFDSMTELKPMVQAALPVLADGTNDGSRDSFEDLWNAVETSSIADEEETYNFLFGHVVQGKCPPYELEYGESEERLQQPHELADLSAFYRAFGLEITDGVGERHDFVSLECEFLAFLCFKEAYAEEHGDSDLALISVDAQRKFLREHLGRWAPAFTRRLERLAPRGLYRALARFSQAHIIAECRRLGVEPGSENLKLVVQLKKPDGCQTCSIRPDLEVSASGADSGEGL